MLSSSLLNVWPLMTQRWKVTRGRKEPRVQLHQALCVPPPLEEHVKVHLLRQHHMFGIKAQPYSQLVPKDSERFPPWQSWPVLQLMPGETPGRGRLQKPHCGGKHQRGTDLCSCRPYLWQKPSKSGGPSAASCLQTVKQGDQQLFSQLKRG